jgi:hypothetical protein
MILEDLNVLYFPFRVVSPIPTVDRRPETADYRSAI